MKVIAFPKLRPEEPVVEALPDDTGAPTAFGGSDEGGRIDRITVRVITVALVLSLFIHLVILLAPLMPKAEAPPASLGKPLTARLEPQESSSRTPPTPVAQPDEAPPPPKTVPRPVVKQPRAQIAVPNRQSPIRVPPAPPTPAPTPEPAPPVAQEQPKQPPAQDMQSYIEARRRARGAPPEEQGETDDERAKRIALGNIQAQQRKANPDMVDGGGGIFSLDRTGLNDADFVFHGWSTDFKRNTGLTVHVVRGDNPDIKLAVVRQMIKIIRERKNGDFEWYSPKRGKSVTMSARPGDTERLELFLLHEFYPEDPRGRDIR